MKGSVHIYKTHSFWIKYRHWLLVQKYVCSSKKKCIWLKENNTSHGVNEGIE